MSTLCPFCANKHGSYELCNFLFLHFDLNPSPYSLKLTHMKLWCRIRSTMRITSTATNTWPLLTFCIFKNHATCSRHLVCFMFQLTRQLPHYQFRTEMTQNSKNDAEPWNWADCVVVHYLKHSKTLCLSASCKLLQYAFEPTELQPLIDLSHQLEINSLS